MPLTKSSLAIGACLALVACTANGVTPEELSQRIVYGSDDRVEYFEASEPVQRALIARSTVALIANRWLDTDGLIASVPSWSTAGGLCPDEPFADEPSVAFCTGVLVDWDLVVTAGHCLRALALEDFSVVFGYYYAEPGRLAMVAGDISDPLEILDEAIPGEDSNADYAWLRLARAVSPSREPVPVATERPPLAMGDAVVSIGAGSGLPLKLDAGSTVRDVGSGTDTFITDTDDSAGWSGGGVFDREGTLLGVLMRGGQDLVSTNAGCATTYRAADSDPAQEEVTFASRAVEALCSRHPSASSICRPSCGRPCRALPLERRSSAAGGCAFGRQKNQSTGAAVALWILGFACWRARKSSGGRRASA